MKAYYRVGALGSRAVLMSAVAEATGATELDQIVGLLDGHHQQDDERDELDRTQSHPESNVQVPGFHFVVLRARLPVAV